MLFLQKTKSFEKIVKKEILDFRVVENSRLTPGYALLRLTPSDGRRLPQSEPGQFVQVAVDGSKTTFLRRPISINFVDEESNELWLLVRRAGDGTCCLTELSVGSTVNLIMPLGHGFSIPADSDVKQKMLLIGGGVGVAPLLQLGKVLKLRGHQPEFLLGARSEADLLELDMFREIGNVNISTDDGSFGEPGLVTANSALERDWDMIYCCGPAPMMKAVAIKARQAGVECEVSLENMMACGLGACLCCVEKTVKGNVCVCTEGPVFNINELTW